MDDRAQMEIANAAARKFEHMRDAILSISCVTIVATVIAIGWWILAG
jgi:hypothetical protein